MKISDVNEGPIGPQPVTGPKTALLLRRLRKALGESGASLSDDELLAEGLSLVLRQIIEGLETDSLGDWLRSMGVLE
jgi:hypothetical protein